MATYGMAVQFLLAQQRDTSTSLEGGTVAFYAAGTDTTQAVYLERTKDTVAANPYTLDSNGTALLYADGLYRIVIKDVDGNTVYDRDYINLVEPDIIDVTSIEIPISQASSPTTTFPYMFWIDTSTTPPTWKVRNGADSNYISIATLNDTGPVIIFNGNLIGNVTGDLTGTATTAANANLLNNQAGSYYTNASNMATGNTPFARNTVGMFRRLGYDSTGVSDTTATIPLDTTAPLISEGNEILRLDNIAVNAATNYLRIHGVVSAISGSVDNHTVLAIFDDSTCIFATAKITVASSRNGSISFDFEYLPGDTSNHSYTVRVGNEGAGTTYIGGYTGTTLNSLNISTLIIDEVLV